MELISNIPNEILFVGAIYKHPDYLVIMSRASTILPMKQQNFSTMQR